eukprot:GILI01024860.1.p1 GENE.GILI01024860.1~~GILI01024860.1.p1  ORF type:complete len:162 (+),score=22.77 GILI01024860.1:32-487(+)
MSYSEKIFSKWMGKHNTDQSKAVSEGMPTSFTASLTQQADSTGAPPKPSAMNPAGLRSLNPQAKDPFLRTPTKSRKFLKVFVSYPFPVRMGGIFVVGFAFGAIIEVFACKTMLYESVTKNKDRRRHEFDEFVVGFRKDMEKWQEEDRRKKQ